MPQLTSCVFDFQGVVVTTLNDSASLSYYKASPVVVAFPIREELVTIF
jgi:hypothetical protein